jgi:hypothetical protein
MMFYEAIVRIAFFKYKQTGKCETTYEGLQVLVENVIKVLCDNADWMPWRVKKLWTLDIDDLYKTNLSAMKKLYQYYFQVKKTKTMNLEDVIEMFTKEVEMNLLPEQISSCWGLCKMTINNDIKQRAQYSSAQLVEFLEFFARLAELRVRDGPLRSSTLQEKIESLMDLVFPIVKAKRKEVQIEIEYQSVSEEDLVEDKYFI